jgi:putative DNA primase/helicase
VSVGHSETRFRHAFMQIDPASEDGAVMERTARTILEATVKRACSDRDSAAIPELIAQIVPHGRSFWLSMKAAILQSFEPYVKSSDLEQAYSEEAKKIRRVRPWEITTPKGTQDLTQFLLNDAGNCDRLIAMHGSNLRYCHPVKKWIVWDGRRWATDTTDQARKLAKETMLEYFRQVVETGAGDGVEKFARGSLDARRLANMLSLAEPEIFVRPDELDSRHDLLNFLNGSVDLRTGELKPHDREDHITKLVHHDYAPAAQCETFLRFLYRIMGDGPDASDSERDRAERLVSYAQKALGYSLTGWTREKVVFMPFGGGNNGKSTLLSTIFQLIPEYSVLLQIDTLMTRQENNNSQADLADLRGARFVMTSETEEGQRLAEGKLKRITQGMGRIKATRKYENPIEFDETHKLWVDANHRPVIRGTDSAIWNRLHSIPFSVTIGPEEIDRELPRKLMAEAEGILAWAVAGAVRWYREGLGKPPEVEGAVEEWRGDMDQIGRFIVERCMIGDEPGYKCQSSALYASYKHWAEEGKEHVAPSKTFGPKIEAKGFEKVSVHGRFYYSGIKLRPSYDSTEVEG